MRRLSIARSVQFALLGLTVVLTAIAAIGVATLYVSRQDYENQLSDALRLQAAAGRLLAAGVVEEATLRLTTAGPRDAPVRLRARSAYDQALASARSLARGDRTSLRLVEASGRSQAALRAAPGGRAAPLAARDPLVALSRHQDARIAAARDRARQRSRRALVAIIAGGSLALLVALALVAGLVAAVRRPLDQLVRASRRLAGGDTEVRVDEDGPDELRTLARSFNAMAADVEEATERVEAERRRLDVTVRSLGDALVIVDADGAVVAANPRAAELVPELAVGARIGESAGEVAPPARLADAQGDEVVIDRDGRTLAVTAAPLEPTGGHVWTVRDVTERARLERLKSEFVATASHELRSPLTSIKGFVELLSSSQGLDPRQTEFVEIVLASTNRLVELVNDLLDVARVEAGRIEIHRRPTDLGEIVKDIVVLLRPRVEQKHQTLDVDLAPGVPRALVDPSRVRQILTNLLTNAHSYTDEGGHIAVAVRSGDDSVSLAVSDSGRGMSPEELNHVFDRFYRGGEADGTKTPGTGLGLSIVRSLVDLHGGTIDVESALGEGTTFTIGFPRVAEPRAPAASRGALAGKRVLVVDDEPAAALLVAERLTAFDVEAEVVHDGAEALRRLRERHFDALTLDILMPGMSGFEVLRALRADPELSRVPVVVVSVFSGREALSGEWVVSKPIDAEELADALGAAVLAGRVRVLALGRQEVRPRLQETLEELSIEHEWAMTAAEAARLCAVRHYEVALVDAGLPDVEAAVAALNLRGRRLRRSVVVFAQDSDAAGFARLDAEPVPLEDAGAVVLGLLDPTTHAG